MSLLARRTAVERFGVQAMTDGLARQLKAFAVSREAT
jgi:hypothetical protein